MKRVALLFVAIASMMLLNSCGVNYAVTGNYNLNTTHVQLSTNNYQIVNKVSGSADVTYVCMIGGLDKEALYANAYAAMMAKADLKGSRAIANVLTEEKTAGFIPFYFTRTITVTANVIEFTR